jgi:hypothetical protein
VKCPTVVPVMADKSQAMSRLAEAGLPVPLSSRITAGEIGVVEELLNRYPDIDYWYLRFDESQIPGLRRVVAAGELASKVSAACVACPNIVFIVHRRVTARVSGVVAVLASGVFIEYLVGELYGLLRAGATPSRLLLDHRGMLLRHEANEQEFMFHWIDQWLVQTSQAMSATPLDRGVLSQLLQAARRVGPGVMLEWVETTTGEVYFVDHRFTPSRFLGDIPALIGGFDSGSFLTMPTARDDRATAAGSTPDAASIKLERPLFEHVPALAGADSFAIGRGGVLAHLCVYAAERGIPSTILSPKTGGSDSDHVCNRETAGACTSSSMASMARS